jgi:hypothetical protein
VTPPETVAVNVTELAYVDGVPELATLMVGEILYTVVVTEFVLYLFAETHSAVIVWEPASNRLVVQLAWLLLIVAPQNVEPLSRKFIVPLLMPLCEMDAENVADCP